MGNSLAETVLMSDSK